MSSDAKFSFLEDFDKTYSGYTNKYLEDRNDIRDYKLQKDHRMIEEPKVDPDLRYSTMKDLERTPLSDLFFSRKNVDYIQYMMKVLVQKETGLIIGRQSDEELLIIMRSTFFSDAKNLPTNIPQQVAELNAKVLKYAVYNEIIPKVKGYNTFLYDNLRTNVVLPQEKFISQKGSRTNRGFSDLI